MKSLLILLFFIIACTSIPKKNVETKKIPKTFDIDVSATDKHRVLFGKISGHSEKQKQKLYKAQLKIDEMVNNKCFVDFILNRKLIKTNGKTGKEVVLDLKTNSHKVDILFYSVPWWKKIKNTTHGYTYPNVDKIWLNNKFHTGTTVCAEASNLHHEISHKYGYGHSSNRHYNRQFSVPYSINAAYGKCCK